MAVLCDGMGGLSKGELASATVVQGFSDWFMKTLPYTDGKVSLIKEQWENLIVNLNGKIWNYGKKHEVELGTTLTVILLIDYKQYIIAQVGDSRTYRIDSALVQLTEDQSFVAREIKRGNMTEEEALTDPRRNVLLQCIGASQNVKPDFVEGKVENESSFLLCSDGFWHKITELEIYQALSNSKWNSKGQIEEKLHQLIQLNMKRGETDNITVIYIGKSTED